MVPAEKGRVLELFHNVIEWRLAHILECSHVIVGWKKVKAFLGHHERRWEGESGVYLGIGKDHVRIDQFDRTMNQCHLQWYGIVDNY